MILRDVIQDRFRQYAKIASEHGFTRNEIEYVLSQTMRDLTASQKSRRPFRLMDSLRSRTAEVMKARKDVEELLNELNL